MSAGVLPLQVIGAPLEYAWGVVSHLLGVKNSEELRNAHQAMQPQVITTMQKLGQSVPVYRVMQALKEDAAAWGALEEAQQRIVESSLRSMKHAGVGLEGEELEAFNKIALELAELSTKFSNNVLDSTKVWAPLSMPACNDLLLRVFFFISFRPTRSRY